MWTNRLIFTSNFDNFWLAKELPSRTSLCGSLINLKISVTPDRKDWVRYPAWAFFLHTFFLDLTPLQSIFSRQIFLLYFGKGKFGGKKFTLLCKGVFSFFFSFYQIYKTKVMGLKFYMDALGSIMGLSINYWSFATWIFFTKFTINFCLPRLRVLWWDFF